MASTMGRTAILDLTPCSIARPWAGPKQARDRFTMAYAVINEDAPAVWLYEPRKIMGIHRRFRTARMRPDAWWAGLADWSIPPSSEF